MKFLIDLIPIALFYTAFKFYDIYVATAVAIVASIAQTSWHRWHTGKFENMHLITLLVIVMLGGLTLLLQDELFIKWKPSIVNWAFAVALLVGSVILKKPTIQALLGAKIALPLKVWKKLNWAWCVFFILSGSLNLYVAYQYSTDTWVDFKFFGMTGITFVFIIFQGIYIARYLKEEG